MLHEKTRLSHGSLFSGIGGFDLGLERAGFKTIWQVEIDDYCSQVLARHFPNATRYADIRSVHGMVAHAESKRLERRRDGQEGIETEPQRLLSAGSGQCESCLAPVDLITGGFPCQPVSHAGKRRGAEDDRYLWPEMLRVIRDLRPSFVVAENVYGLVTYEGGILLDTVLSDLEASDYETLPPVIIPACAFDAPHRRDRVWILAHARHHERGSKSWEQQAARAEIVASSGTGDVADANSQSSGWIAEPPQK